jgi:DNA-directed RNA polymerase subunit RPC12/RpoP
MLADIVFDGENTDGSGIGTIKICCMHDPYDLRCPVCGHSVFSKMGGNTVSCETCGIQLTLFPDRAACRFLMEVQGA